MFFFVFFHFFFRFFFTEDCAVCSTGYAGDISNGCHRCSQSFEAGMYLLVAVGGVVALLFAWLLFRYLVRILDGHN